MPKHNADDNIMMRPLPSSRVPWLVILFLVTCLVLVYLGFLRPQHKLLGPPLPENTYQQYVKPRKPPVRTPAPAPAPSTAAPAPGSATTPAATAPGADTAPTAAPAMPGTSE
ncbi:MAG: hypothetical protein ACYDCO_05205 [Armatimonadota bacterium]